ncbi:SMI1/KNR4 family protein [Streptomyces sp. NRRL S-1022]|uniref:SMI1/KNR4 family protein n=1 Tax=Streptomyces sp. NRRL S-1022 TaxID=1463880 RepID=UPI0004C0E738|nr:SMI1/KNR4 family protein [Streptomyces sp. NRRL S-1022]
MTDSDYWRAFLTRWSHEWADAQDPDAPDDERLAGDEEVLRTRWLGFPPASEERIRALEERLGHRLPPSYRAFLSVSDGWRHAGGFVWLLAGTDQVRRHQDAAGLSEHFPGDPDDDAAPEEELPAGMWQRALELDVESDAVHILMDPGDVDADGEWPVYSYASWRASPPERYGSFRAFMEDMYREFHSLQMDRSHRTGQEFVNATTRALDASVEEARLEALRGRYEEAGTALAEALEYGRPRAAGLRDQIRRMLGQTYTVSFHGLTTDPLYAPEVLPVLAAEHVSAHRDDYAWSYHLGDASPAAAETAREILRDVREGTYRYAPGGAFGRAVAQAREQARWGDTDEAWRTLRAALPEWRPVGPDHIAPVGLCADPLLGPLVTPERGRELLATPRAGRRGVAPAPAADVDPPGLAWLTEVDPGHVLSSSYRFVLVAAVEPAELPGRLGADETTVLDEPVTLWESRMRLRGGADAPGWEDRALACVGRAGAGWSFALEARPGGGFAEKWFDSPGVAASDGTRAVTVWSEPSDGHRPGVFHLSVAEHGEERYAFTVRGTAAVRGSLPAALDPERLFRPDDPPAERLGERRALEALAAEYGVRLPRFALTRGRLHTFRTRPWNRPPGPGEGYWALRFVRSRP